jgi:hypothetical protein
MSNTNRPTLKTRNLAVANGIDKHVPSSISIGGVTYTPPELKAVFTNQNAAVDAADALHKQWTDQVQVARTVGAKANAVYPLLRSFLIGQYGNDANAILNDFGMPVPKAKGAKTVQVKADAVTKRNATRAARHTMGAVQRKAVTGASASPAAPATTAAPDAHATPAAASAAPSPAAPVAPTTTTR